MQWLRCGPPIFGGTEFDTWQQIGSSSPYLWCKLPRVTVGPKHLRIAIAGQNVTIDKETETLTPFCLTDYYGQQQDAVYIGPTFGMCGDECEKDSWQCKDSWNKNARNHTIGGCEGEKHCEMFGEVSGSNRNCTVITRHDEYCTACPGGATCEMNTQYAEEPESLEGYWRNEWPVSEGSHNKNNNNSNSKKSNTNNNK